MDRDSASTPYLYDFLYVDKPRIGSYFAQMFDSGVISPIAIYRAVRKQV